MRSADRGHLDFPRVKLASYGVRSFAYAGPSNWNSLPAYLRDGRHYGGDGKVFIDTVCRP